MKTTTANIFETITADRVAVEAWETSNGVQGIVWEDGQEGPSINAESFAEVAALAARAGFDYAEAENAAGSLVADWTEQDRSNFLELAR